jgi:hypothetical protein
VASQPSDTRKIPGGLRVVIYRWVTIDTPKMIPQTLRPKLSFSVPAADGKPEDRYLEIGGPEENFNRSDTISNLRFRGYTRLRRYDDDRELCHQSLARRP